MAFALNIFDYDGVLVDSLDDVISVSSAFCQSISHNKLPTKETIAALQNMTYHELARSLELTPEQGQAFAGYVFEQFQKMGRSMSFFPGIESFLRRLAPANMAIVSGNSADVIRAKLAAHGLDIHISRIWGAYEEGDKAAKIQNACSHFNADPDGTCMIGDSVSDLRCAKKAGVKSIAVTWGWQTRAMLEKERPDHIVESIAQLTALLM